MLRADIVNLGSINESSAFTLTVQSLNEAGAAEAPTTLEWTLECLESSATLQDWTAVSPTLGYDVYGVLDSAEVDIAVSALLHTMQTAHLTAERKSLTVSANRGTSTERNQVNLYTVVRTGISG